MKLRSFLWIVILFISLVFFVFVASASKAPEKENDEKSQNNEKNKSSGKSIDWGGWESAEYGVGVRGALQKELNQLDKSNLLKDATGVALGSAKRKGDKKNKIKKPKDIRKTIEQLKAKEEKLRRELKNDSEF